MSGTHSIQKDTHAIDGHEVGVGDGGPDDRLEDVDVVAVDFHDRHKIEICHREKVNDFVKNNPRKPLNTVFVDKQILKTQQSISKGLGPEDSRNLFNRYVPLDAKGKISSFCCS